MGLKKVPNDIQGVKDNFADTFRLIWERLKIPLFAVPVYPPFLGQKWADFDVTPHFGIGRT